MANFRVSGLIICLSMVSVAYSEPPVQGYHYQQNGYHQNGYQQNGYHQNGYQQNGYHQNGYHSNFNTPSETYLPPKTGLTLPSSYLPPNTFAGSGHYDNQNHQAHHHQHHGNENEVPKSYEFGYSVKDAQSGNDYNRRESSDGNVVRGEYRVQLPDGRTQIVTYHADWQTGYHANVRYEGQARYPDTTNKGYNYNPPQYSGSINGFNSHGSSYKPSTLYGPPGYQ